MKDFNLVTVSGRLGRDPELKKINENVSVVDFSIANAQDYFDKNKNEWVNRAYWLPVKAFSPLADKISEKFSKGDHVIITGELREESWETKDGEKRSRVIVYANKVELMGSVKKSSETAQEDNQYAQQDYVPYEPLSDDDIF